MGLDNNTSVSIIWGEGDLGQIYSRDERLRYQLTWDDMLWCARMLVGEEGISSSTLNYSAVLWAMAQRYYFTRTHFHTFTEFIQAYSQPINPKWRRDGLFCRPGGSKNGQPECSSDKLDRRDTISGLQWNEISPNIRRVVINWAKGNISNPIPKATDFAVPSVARRKIGDDNQHPFRLVYDTRGRPESSSESGGNAFYSIPASRRWEDNFIFILFGQTIAQDSSLEEVEQSTSTTFTSNSSDSNQEIDNELFERAAAITSNRENPPNDHLLYFTLSASTRDPQSAEILSENQERRMVKSNDDRFYQQIISLKNVSTLDMSRTLPVLMITTQDKNGDIVNLNEKIFSKSPFHNQFEDQDLIEGLEIEFPDRPIASIVGMTVKVETPSVGGPTAITNGTLKIKIHNPSLVYENHPFGRYVLYMMKMGFSMRIRYGIEPLQHGDNAFQWKEENFYVAQYNISINDDKTYDLDINILPAAQKLFNQIHIGESIPFSDLQRGSEPITQDDLRQAFLSAISNNSTEAQRQDLQRRLQAFANVFNRGEPSPGYRITQRENEQGQVTLGSVLHGAISQSNILENVNTIEAIPVENMVDALRTIQSILLTKRIQSLLQNYAYNDRTKQIPRVVVNFGALVDKLIRPEMETIAQYVSQNNDKIGEEFSSDTYRELNSQEQPPRRTSVKIIFGNFNQRAGQWADKPLSMFPINADAIFAHLREEREVGQFSSTINAFISRINTIINEPSNFNVVRQQTFQKGERQFPLERPQIKYSFYPDPTDETSWIMYFYDNKVPLVRFREMLGSLAGPQNVQVPKDTIIQRLQDLHIPFIEMGEEGSIIKNMTARTVADDLLLTHNMIQANQQAITMRQADGSVSWPAGISREFAAGAQLDPQNVIRSTTLIMPIEVTLTTHNIISAYLFTPIYIFFPTPQFSALYLPYVVEHEIRDGMAQTRFTLQVNLAGNSAPPT